MVACPVVLWAARAPPATGRIKSGVSSRVTSLPIAVVGGPRCAQPQCASLSLTAFLRVFECEFDVVCRRRVIF